MEICRYNTIKTELSREDFLWLHNESKKFDYNMKLYELEKELGYADYKKNPEFINVYFNNNTIGKYLPSKNKNTKYSYIIVNGKIVDEDCNLSNHDYVIYNLNNTKFLSNREYLYFVSMYNFITYKLKNKYEQLSKVFDTNGFEVSENDIAIDNDWMNKTTMSYLCYLMSLNLLLPKEEIIQYIDKSCNQDLINYVSSSFDVSDYSVYVRLNQLSEGYLVDELTSKYLQDSIKTYKNKLSIK
jgi:hypothetical protein